ncbi:MTRF1L release factor glutamine methyltransferase-like [Pollicipes pollicipes]|uniref:MTRF1L release factor glutamine methyltransferase-like n=1 Tax=Pollicipes pollicipes TaxID=41117 RepID=UPI001884AF1B|nr:MTRF1L release factor glutamine methyltransferase-like [Pollicipes pollicipes]
MSRLNIMHVFPPSTFCKLRWLHCHGFSCKIVSCVRNLSQLSGQEASNKVQSLLQFWKSQFIQSKVSEPAESVQYIMSAVLKCARGDLARLAETELDAGQRKNLERFCLCRLHKMPVQYIIGEWDFCDVTLKLRPPVFIPRPETEQLAQLAAERLRQRGGGRLLEVGCGSGALSVALLHWLQDDQSADACRLTEENAARLGVEDRLRVYNATLTEDSLPGEHRQLYDLVVSNPPYLTTAELRRLQPEILLYEDRAALDGGPDGLRVTRRLLRHAPGWLRPGGRLLLELDPAQPARLGGLLADSGSPLRHDHTHSDYAGRQRFAELCLPP